MHNDIDGVKRHCPSGADADGFPIKMPPGEIWLIRVYKGEAQALCNFKPMSLRSGTCVLLTDEVPFRFRSASEGFRADIISLSIRFLDSVYFSIGSLMPALMSVASTEYFREDCAALVFSSFEVLSRALDTRLPIGKEKMVQALALQILLAFSNGFASQEMPAISYSAKCQEQLNHFIGLILRGGPSHRRDAGFYASRMGISTRYLYRICKEITGQSPKEIIDGILIGGIKQALSADACPIGDIGLDYGFEDPTAFGQYFKRHTGTTLSAFRKQYR